MVRFVGPEVKGFASESLVWTTMRLSSTARFSRTIESAQTKVEGFNFDYRKHLVEYDDVIRKQREISLYRGAKRHSAWRRCP